MEATSLVMTKKDAIRAAFNGSAHSYDHFAQAQAFAAQGLAERLRLRLKSSPARLLEFGCGTGLFSGHLLDLAPQSDITLTDLAPSMVETCREKWGEAPGRSYRVMDAERPDLDGPFDLIAGSLAAQWFGKPDALSQLGALLVPGGTLALSTLTPAAFAQWRAALKSTHSAQGVWEYPDADILKSRLTGFEVTIETDCLTLEHGSGLDFLRSLRGLGADTPRPGHDAVKPGQMRKVLRAFEQDHGARCDYSFYYLFARRPEA